MAVDVVPESSNFPDGKFDWRNILIFEKMCDVILQTAINLGISLRQGRTWGDYPHQELI